MGFWDTISAAFSGEPRRILKGPAAPPAPEPDVTAELAPLPEWKVSEPLSLSPLRPAIPDRRAGAPVVRGGGQGSGSPLESVGASSFPWLEGSEPPARKETREAPESPWASVVRGVGQVLTQVGTPAGPAAVTATPEPPPLWPRVRPWIALGAGVLALVVVLRAAR